MAVCRNVQTVFGYGNLNTVPCIHCGQCTANCWNNGVTERFQLQEVYNAITSNKKNKGTKKFVAIVAPSTRVTLGEMFKMEHGTNVEKPLITALRKLGFDFVMDVTFGADLTVMEEAAEFEEYIQSDRKKPMFTSCCPAWVKFAQLFFPDSVPQISSCKSPMRMQGAILKSYFAREKGIRPEDVVVVAISPCTAKKYERTLGNELDFVLTTREIGWWIQELGVDFAQLPPGEWDSLTGSGSGAGVIFGNTGGVTEAVLRQIYYSRTHEIPPKDFLLFTPVRGLDGMRRAEVKIGGETFRIGIVHGTSAAREMFRLLDSQKFDFIEVMACRGGCIGGGGLPKTEIPITDSLRTKRMSGLYAADKAREIHLSALNPEIQTLYSDFLNTPGNEALHTKHILKKS